MRRLTEREWTSLIAVHPELDALPAGLRLHADHVVAAAGRSLFRQGTLPARRFWALEGEIRLVRRSRKGAEVVLQRTSSGFMAEASLDSPRYHCDALAVFDSRLIAFPIDLF